MTGSFETTALPLLFVFASFVVTFLVTRLITRLIRAGIGPFKDNVSDDGVHVHHAVYGIFALLAGAVINTATANSIFRCLGAVLIGAGASLILDEFALILHLRDVYWEREGRASVQAVALAAACLGLACTGFVPVTSDDFEGGPAVVAGSVIALLLFVWCAWICARKGKYRLVLLSIFVLPLALVGAVRLARSGSPWFTKHYAPGSRKAERAVERAERSDRRWGGRWIWFANAVASAPNPQDPTAPAAAVGSHHDAGASPERAR